MTLYELNQAGYNALPELKNKDLLDAVVRLQEFLSSFKDTNYFMMLNHENRYYTIYTYGENNSTSVAMAETMIDIAKTLGTLKAVEINECMAEFWITDSIGVCNMYAVFPYDKGVIEV